MDTNEHVLPLRLPETMLPVTSAVFHILLALGKEDMYGLIMMQEIELLTHGQIRLGPGTLYRSLQHMVHDGLIEECSERDHLAPHEERRRVYRITSFGWQVAHLESQRLAILVEAAQARGFLSNKQE